MIHHRSICLVLAAVCCVAVGANAQEPSPKKWLTGEAFQRQLESRTGIVWSSESLRQKLKSLAEHTQIAFWLDRRIDPTQQPDISIPETTLTRCYESIAEQLDVGVCYIGPVVYFGPRSVAGKLATIAELRRVEVGKLPTEARDRLNRAKAWTWEDLATPKELLAQLAADAKIEIVGLEKIPHDLWSAGDLPPLSLTDRLSLALAGFELTFEFDKTGKKVRFAALPDRPTMSRTYAVRGDVDMTLGKLQASVPAASLTVEGTNIVAVCRLEEHQQIARLLQGEKPRPLVAGEAVTVFSMKGPQFLGAVLKTLQVQVGLKITLDAAAQAKLRDRVVFDVKSASLEDLLTAVLRDTGLKFQLSGKELKIFAP